ncbi:MHYT domain-containing protein [Streptomyces pratensis]|uniref:MHYT domain-containing protein n=1 Tax=Streptomyces pratensis TaxID=1169025 RepID=UPI00301B401C
MQGTVDGFTYGLVTPVAAFLMACLGAALGLRCITRSLSTPRSFKAVWLALGALSIGFGVWTVHFVAMTGFTVAEAPFAYDMPLTFAGLVMAVGMVGIGVFIVGYRGPTRMALITGGSVTGLGVASMHYLGMAGMRMQGYFTYDLLGVVLSALVPAIAATVALWAAVAVRGLLASLGASVVMAVAVTGMHYTGMDALNVHLHPAASTVVDGGHGGVGGGHTFAEGAGSVAPIVPMLIGPACFLLLAAVAVLIRRGTGTGAAGPRHREHDRADGRRLRTDGRQAWADGRRP